MEAEDTIREQEELEKNLKAINLSENQSKMHHFEGRVSPRSPNVPDVDPSEFGRTEDMKTEINYMKPSFDPKEGEPKKN